jgi:hypothetical protein
MNTTKLATKALKAPRTKKSVTLIQETTVLADGSTMVPLDVSTPSDVLQASLLMLFKHVADIHITLVEIVAEKFDLKIDDIHKVVNEDPRWSAMMVNPLITDLTKTVNEHSVPVSSKKKKAVVISDEPDLVFD